MSAGRQPRLENLLASVSLNLAAEGQAALDEVTGLTGSATTALLALEELAGDAHVGRLADVLGLTHSGAVRLVTLLERHGLAVRRPGADRRHVSVRLTDLGRETARSARAARGEVLRQAVGGLDVDEAADLEALLAKVVEARVTARLAQRRNGSSGAWWCRTCDFSDCGRPVGRCPAVRATRPG